MDVNIAQDLLGNVKDRLTYASDDESIEEASAKPYPAVQMRDGGNGENEDEHGIGSSRWVESPDGLRDRFRRHRVEETEVRGPRSFANNREFGTLCRAFREGEVIQKLDIIPLKYSVDSAGAKAPG